jgi:hypothetical protein
VAGSVQAAVELRLWTIRRPWTPHLPRLAELRISGLSALSSAGWSRCWISRVWLSRRSRFRGSVACDRVPDRTFWLKFGPISFDVASPWRQRCTDLSRDQHEREVDRSSEPSGPRQRPLMQHLDLGRRSERRSAMLVCRLLRAKDWIREWPLHEQGDSHQQEQVGNHTWVARCYDARIANRCEGRRR